jgi:hypothetical protein
VNDPQAPRDETGLDPADEVAAARAAVRRAACATADTSAGDEGGWVMAPDAIAFVGAVATELACTHVVEFGSGRSTVALAGVVAGRGAVSSVENDPDAAAATRAVLDGAGLGEHVTVVSAPLVVRRVDGRHLPVYRFDPGDLSSAQRPGLVVVDGPPAKLGGREGALRQALALAGPGTVVVLDDAGRDGEARAFADVTAHHAGSVEVIDVDGFARGLGVIVVTAEPKVVFAADSPADPDGADEPGTRPGPSPSTRDRDEGGDA